MKRKNITNKKQTYCKGSRSITHKAIMKVKRHSSKINLDL